MFDFGLISLSFHFKLKLQSSPLLPPPPPPPNQKFLVTNGSKAKGALVTILMTTGVTGTNLDQTRHTDRTRNKDRTEKIVYPYDQIPQSITSLYIVSYNMTARYLIYYEVFDYAWDKSIKKG